MYISLFLFHFIINQLLFFIISILFYYQLNFYFLFILFYSYFFYKYWKKSRCKSLDCKKKKNRVFIDTPRRIKSVSCIVPLVVCFLNRRRRESGDQTYIRLSLSHSRWLVIASRFSLLYTSHASEPSLLWRGSSHERTKNCEKFFVIAFARNFTSSIRFFPSANKKKQGELKKTNDFLSFRL